MSVVHFFRWINSTLGVHSWQSLSPSNTTLIYSDDILVASNVCGDPMEYVEPSPELRLVATQTYAIRWYDCCRNSMVSDSQCHLGLMIINYHDTQMVEYCGPDMPLLLWNLLTAQLILRKII